MKAKILDFKLLLTIVLVVVCFWGDRFSSFNIKENRFQNLSFIKSNISDHHYTDEHKDVDKKWVISGTQSVCLEQKNNKHTLIKAVKERP